MRIHKVQENDTLEKIAENYRIDKEDLARQNFLINPSGLCEGIELIIPKMRCELCSQSKKHHNTLSEKYKISSNNSKAKNTILPHSNKKNDKEHHFSIYPKNEKRAICTTALFDEIPSRELLSHILPFLTYISLPYGDGIYRYDDIIKKHGVEKIMCVNPLSDKSRPKEIADKAVLCGCRIVIVDIKNYSDGDYKIINDIYEELSNHKIHMFLRSNKNLNLPCECLLTNCDSISCERRRLARPLPYAATKSIDGIAIEIPISDAMAVACKRLVKFNVTQNGCSYECDEGKRHVKVALPSLSLWKKILDDYDSRGIASFYIDNVSSFYPPLFAMLSERYNIIKSFPCKGVLR